MDLDDTDGRSKPFCEQTIHEPVQLVSFRIELRNLSNSSDAKILRRKERNQITEEYENVAFVKFDTQSKSYEYSIFNPDVGYHYRIEWEK